VSINSILLLVVCEAQPHTLNWYMVLTKDSLLSCSCCFSLGFHFFASSQKFMSSPCVRSHLLGQKSENLHLCFSDLVNNSISSCMLDTNHER
jgi:hypothetical protein